MRRLFSPQRLEAVARRIPAERRRSAAGQWLLFRLLQEYAPQIVFPPRFAYGWQEKPSLADAPELHFNLSHSGDWAACVLSSAEAGIDIQQERPLRSTLVRKFSLSEQSYLKTLPEREKAQKIIDIWCLKEAYCKCTGDGLRTPLSATSFTLDPLSIDREGYQVHLLNPSETGYHLALCLRTEESCSIQTTIITPPKG